jgi:glycopeptide antibiotics resistance protein
MGGAQLARSVAVSEEIGNYNAFVVSSMMGLVISFTIPFALGVVKQTQRKELFFGLLCGIATIPFGCFAAGLVCGLDILTLLINLLPLVYLFDYEIRREAILNFVGNTAMFIPIGVIWPTVFRKLNTHGKVLAAGGGLSLCIEILQLPFFGRATDIDDLILNSLGFLMGYGIYLLVRKLKKRGD